MRSLTNHLKLQENCSQYTCRSFDILAAENAKSNDLCSTLYLTNVKKSMNSVQMFQTKTTKTIYSPAIIRPLYLAQTLTSAQRIRRCYIIGQYLLNLMMYLLNLMIFCGRLLLQLWLLLSYTFGLNRVKLDDDCIETMTAKSNWFFTKSAACY